MTVMTLGTIHITCENDWGKEKEVEVVKDKAKSFGICIVGGTVNVSQDVVSGLFIKNIIPNSPADKCGLLKIGDRILKVDGTDIRHSTHEYAMKIIKNSGRKMILLVQSLTKKMDDCTETSAFLKKAPPPITPCKTPESELIQQGTKNRTISIKIHDDGNDERYITANDSIRTNDSGSINNVLKQFKAGRFADNSQILCRRLSPFAREFVRHYQTGFMGSRTTMDQIFAIRQVPEECLKYNVPHIICSSTSNRHMTQSIEISYGR
ncbi:inaD-like protein [Topomyia yanbarensis]|uniref:inaD-like protein n=1 Tax=Topomyia yanbarensis TaxID=2498891 RepID=UPI00273B5C80|nr:inaD-like protein [Topomyia yanbarensis]